MTNKKRKSTEEFRQLLQRSREVLARSEQTIKDLNDVIKKSQANQKQHADGTARKEPAHR